MGLGRLWRACASVRGELAWVVCFGISQDFVGKVRKVGLTQLFISHFTFKHRDEEQGVFR